MPPVSHITPYTSLIGFLIGFPTTVATYYQAWKARQESRQMRQAMELSRNCLEFVTEEGVVVNVVSLATLHSLPQPGEIVLLPGTQASASPGAYRVRRVEHMYVRMDAARRGEQGHVRLGKTIAHVEDMRAILDGIA